MKHLNATLFVGIVALLALESCALPSFRQSVPSGNGVSTRDGSWGGAKAQEASTAPLAGARDGGTTPLYGRDGTPVSAQPGGTVALDGRPSRELDGKDGSRMYILELYQQAVNEKEALQLEVQALSAALDQTEAERVSVVTKLMASEAANAALKSDLEAERVRSKDLAERLTTAQIRRLEAEKLLLEAKIEWQRVQDVIRAEAAMPSTSATKGSVKR